MIDIFSVDSLTIPPASVEEALREDTSAGCSRAEAVDRNFNSIETCAFEGSSNAFDSSALAGKTYDGFTNCWSSIVYADGLYPNGVIPANDRPNLKIDLGGYYAIDSVKLVAKIFKDKSFYSGFNRNAGREDFYDNFPKTYELRYLDLAGSWISLGVSSTQPDMVGEVTRKFSTVVTNKLEIIVHEVQNPYGEGNTRSAKLQEVIPQFLNPHSLRNRFYSNSAGRIGRLDAIVKDSYGIETLAVPTGENLTVSLSDTVGSVIAPVSSATFSKQATQSATSTIGSTSGVFYAGLSASSEERILINSPTLGLSVTTSIQVVAQDSGPTLIEDALSSNTHIPTTSSGVQEETCFNMNINSCWGIRQGNASYGMWCGGSLYLNRKAYRPLYDFIPTNVRNGTTAFYRSSNSSSATPEAAPYLHLKLKRNDNSSHLPSISQIRLKSVLAGLVSQTGFPVSYTIYSRNPDGKTWQMIPLQVPNLQPSSPGATVTLQFNRTVLTREILIVADELGQNATPNFVFMLDEVLF
jgi:hypothetical protein